MYYFDVIIYLFRYFVTKHLTNHDKCAIFIIVERMPKFKLFGFFTDLFIWNCTIVFNANLILLECIKLPKATVFFKEFRYCSDGNGKEHFILLMRKHCKNISSLKILLVHYTKKYIIFVFFNFCHNICCIMRTMLQYVS